MEGIKSILIKDTTREERIRIVNKSLEVCGQECQFCNGCDNIGGGRTDIEYHNIHKNEEDRQELIRVGGKQQVPCLFIDGKPMYESDDIVEWLRANPEI